MRINTYLFILSMVWSSKNLGKDDESYDSLKSEARPLHLVNFENEAVSKEVQDEICAIRREIEWNKVSMKKDSDCKGGVCVTFLGVRIDYEEFNKFLEAKSRIGSGRVVGEDFHSDNKFGAFSKDLQTLMDFYERVSIKKTVKGEEHDFDLKFSIRALKMYRDRAKKILDRALKNNLWRDFDDCIAMIRKILDGIQGNSFYF